MAWLVEDPFNLLPIFREHKRLVDDEEELNWRDGLKHVEQEEEKSPSPEVRKPPEQQEFERTVYEPMKKRERPEVG